ncbi:MAG: PorV/PorQ family protein [Elusimicrobia bacterium]|nr:PorV/PorQ family protein [Elusimicrobiota bacterium]
MRKKEKSLFSGDRTKGQRPGRWGRYTVRVGLFGVIAGGWILVNPLNAGFFAKTNRGRTGPAILKLEPGVRALSLGGAYVGMADDSNALFWNPAGLQRTPRPELLVGHARIFEDQSQDYIGFVRPTWRRGERESWGISASYLAIDRFDLVKEGTPAGSAQPWEGTIGLSYAHPFRDVQWGVTGKVAQKSLPGVSAQSFAVDIGLQKVAHDLKSDWGLVLANLGTPMTLGTDKISPPLVIRFGASRKITLGKKNHLRFSAQFDAPYDDLSVGRLGAEYVLPGKEWALALRAGAQTAGATRLSAGFGVGRGSLSMNYAYAPSERLGDSQRLDMAFRFGSPLAQEEKRRALFDQARSAWTQGQAAKAADILEEISAISPHYYPAVQLAKDVNRRIEESLKPETLFNLGMQAFTKKEHETAAAYFRKLVILDPRYPEAAELLKKSESFLAAQRDAQAREEIKRAKMLERQTAYQAARDLQREERWEEALRAWRKALARFPNEKEATTAVKRCREKLLDRAAAAEQAGDTEKAIATLRHLQQDDPDRAIERRVHQLEKSDHAEKIAQSQTLYRDGVRAYDAGDLKTALPLFEKAAHLNPADSAIARARDRVQAELAKQPHE